MKTKIAALRKRVREIERTVLPSLRGWDDLTKECRRETLVELESLKIEIAQRSRKREPK